MNLVSCNECGAVFDKDKIIFPDDYANEEGVIDTNKAAWDGDRFVPFIKCRVCGKGEISE